jgi:hypothetical protein
VKEGRDPERTFRFWTGDDTDASVVIDAEGMLYVAQEVERASSRARNTEVGQLVKIDPTKPDDPIVWSVPDDRRHLGHAPPSGTAWSTPPPTAVASWRSTSRPARSCGRRSCPARPGSRRWWSTTC